MQFVLKKYALHGNRPKIHSSNGLKYGKMYQTAARSNGRIRFFCCILCPAVHTSEEPGPGSSPLIESPSEERRAGWDKIMWKIKDVYYISGSTGILVADFGRALLRQFPETSFHEEKFAFVKTREQAQKVLQRILKQSGGRKPLVFSTLMEPDIKQVFDVGAVEFFDVFEVFLQNLETVLETAALRSSGASRLTSDLAMEQRVDAINFTLEHDDGVRTAEYDPANVILLGVSRTGKTPVSVYLSTQHGIKAANYPFTPEVLNKTSLPEPLRPFSHKCIGLTTSATILHQSRTKRYPGSSYAGLQTCSQELEQARLIFTRHHIPIIETAHRSIEETATQVLTLIGRVKKAET